MKRLLIVLGMVALLGGCSVLKDAATGAVKGATGVDSGLSVETEIKNADGDVVEETNVGSEETNQTVTADTVTEAVAGDKTEQVAQVIENYKTPSWVVWLIIGLSISNLLFWALDSPGTLWRKFKRKQNNGNLHL